MRFGLRSALLVPGAVIETRIDPYWFPGHSPLGLIGVPLPGIEYGIALSAILLGAAVMFEVRPPLGVASALVGFFAIFHGHAHGTELPLGQSALLYSMGFVIATGCLHAVGIGIGTVHRWPWGQKLLRLAGAFVAAGGVFFLWKAVA